MTADRVAYYGVSFATVERTHPAGDPRPGVWHDREVVRATSSVDAINAVVAALAHRPDASLAWIHNVDGPHAEQTAVFEGGDTRTGTDSTDDGSEADGG